MTSSALQGFAIRECQGYTGHIQLVLSVIVSMILTICCGGMPCLQELQRGAQVDTEAERELKLPGSETAEHGSTFSARSSNMPEKAFKACIQSFLIIHKVHQVMGEAMREAYSECRKKLCGRLLSGHTDVTRGRNAIRVQSCLITEVTNI